MWWRRKQKAARESAGQDLLARKLLSGYRFIQVRWVGWMELLIKGWSPGKQRRAFFVAVVLGTTYYGWLIFSGVTGHARDKLIIEKIQPGEYIGKPGIPMVDSSKRFDNKLKR